MRIITIILPNRDTLRLEISGDETETKELISTLSDIPITDIKGLKDKYGNNKHLRTNRPHNQNG
jgi:hypothetical protein